MNTKTLFLNKRGFFLPAIQAINTLLNIEYTNSTEEVISMCKEVINKINYYIYLSYPLCFAIIAIAAYYGVPG